MAAFAVTAVAALEVMLAREHHQRAFPVKIFTLNEWRAWACGVLIIRLHYALDGEGKSSIDVCGGQLARLRGVETSFCLTMRTRADYARAQCLHFCDVTK